MPSNLQNKKLTPEEAEQMMLEYKQNGSIELRNCLVMHYSYIAKSVAANMSSTFHKYASTEEMVHQGVIALIDSLQRFKPEKGIKFSTYAYTKVRGAVIDYVRKQDWLPRRVRQTDIQINKTEEELTAKLGRTPTRTEMAEQMGMSLKEFDHCIYEMSGGHVYSFESFLEAPTQTKSFITRDDESDPEENIYKKELEEELAKAIDTLNEQERTVLSLYYYENLTMKEIGFVMGVSEQRIGQINRKLIQKLRDILSDYMKG